MRLLDADTAKIIYAGQHIFSVHNLIKELVENSIDAQSNNIQICISDAKNLESIEVYDDGHGIKQDELAKIGLKNYSSKAPDGLKFGYKGEALHCIAECCKEFEIHSRHGDDAYGHVYAVHSMSENLIAKAREIGTTVKIVNPFYKLPLRAQEWRRNKASHVKSVTKALKLLALVNPIKIRFSIKDIGGEVVLFQSIGSSDISAKLCDMFDFNLKLERSCTVGHTEVLALVGYSTKRINLSFWNRRALNHQIARCPDGFSSVILVKDTSGLVYESYSKTSCQAAILNTEVENILATMVNSIRALSPIRTSNLDISPSTFRIFEDIPSASLGNGSAIKSVIKKDDLRSLGVLGQFNNSFILAKLKISEEESSLVILDQHAVDERIHYEKVSSSPFYSSSQNLIADQKIKFGLLESQLIDRNIKLLEEYGFKFCAQDGVNSLTHVPVICGQPFSVSDLTALCETGNEDDDSSINFRTKLDHMFATKACKLAVKIREPLKIEKMKALLLDLSGLQNPWA